MPSGIVEGDTTHYLIAFRISVSGMLVAFRRNRVNPNSVVLICVGIGEKQSALAIGRIDWGGGTER